MTGRPSTVSSCWAPRGSYYVDEQHLTIENAQAVRRCVTQDGERTVQRIVAISEAGRAPKNDPAIFALAIFIQTVPAEERLGRMTVFSQIRIALCSSLLGNRLHMPLACTT